MKYRPGWQILTACLATLILVSPLAAANPLADLEAVERGFMKLATEVEPSVVAIETRVSKRIRNRVPMVGSGFVVHPSGLIATNDHVVRDADEVFVVLAGGRRHTASIVGRDPRSDLAVISIPVSNLKPAALCDLSEVRVGQWALAMGNPFGMARDGKSSLSYGIVSALGKSLPELETDDAYYGNLIQTSAAINPGNSGGPLFNIRGEVIGVNTAIETASGNGEGIGFAIPISSRTRNILDTLARGEIVEYGFLGVQIRDGSDPQIRGAFDGDDRGVVVSKVYDDTAASRARIRSGDMLVQFRGTRLTSMDQLIRLVGSTPVGERVSVQLFRGEQLMERTVKIQNRRAVSLAQGSKD